MANEDKATRYHRLQRRASLLAAAAAAVLLALLLISGLTFELRDLARAAAGGSSMLEVALYTGLLLVLAEVVQLPFAYYQGVTLEHRYALAAGGPGRWWIDRIKAAVLGAGLAVPAAVIAYALIAWTPIYWWLLAALVFAALLALLAQAAPVILLPFFYRIVPLDRPELTSRLMALAHRARADVLGVFEWRLGDRTRKANAALTGLGRTRRILLSDTLLAEHSDDEIEVILAHELAHHVHRDVWTGLALEAGVLTFGLLAADRALAAWGPALGLADKSDPAGLPLLVLAAAAVSVALVPVAYALSRAHERRADAYALEMTEKPEAFMTAMRKLAASNLAEERPGRVVEVLFHSHPSTSARVAAARAWAAARDKR